MLFWPIQGSEPTVIDIMFPKIFKSFLCLLLISFAGCSNGDQRENLSSEIAIQQGAPLAINGVDGTAFVQLGDPIPVERFVPPELQEAENLNLIIDYTVINKPNYVYYTYSNKRGEIVREKSHSAIILIDQVPCTIEIQQSDLSVQKNQSLDLSEYIQVSDQFYMDADMQIDRSLEFIHGMVPGSDFIQGQPGYIIYDKTIGEFLDGPVISFETAGLRELIVIASDGFGNISLNTDFSIQVSD